MPVIYCNLNMFDMTSQVFAIKENAESWPLFAGTFEEICEFIATEYQTHKYDKIVLSGPYATAVEDRVRAYSLANYNSYEINIGVI